MLVVCQRDAFFDFSGVLAAVEKDVFDTAWKKIKENPDQFTGVDGAPECRETNLKTGCNLISPDLAGGPGENLLTGAAALLMEWGIARGNDLYMYGDKLKASLIKGAGENVFTTASRAVSENTSKNTKYPNPVTGWGTLCLLDSIP